MNGTQIDDLEDEIKREIELSVLFLLHAKKSIKLYSIYHPNNTQSKEFQQLIDESLIEFISIDIFENREA